MYTNVFTEWKPTQTQRVNALLDVAKKVNELDPKTAMESLGERTLKSLIEVFILGNEVVSKENLNGENYETLDKIYWGSPRNKAFRNIELIKKYNPAEFNTCGYAACVHCYPLTCKDTPVEDTSVEDTPMEGVESLKVQLGRIHRMTLRNYQLLEVVSACTHERGIIIDKVFNAGVLGTGSAELQDLKEALRYLQEEVVRAEKYIQTQEGK